MRVLVTGGSGRVGGCTVQYLAQRHEVVVFDVERDENLQAGFVKGDILDLEAVGKAVHGMDAMLHMAAIPSPCSDPPHRVVRTNTMGTFNTIQAAYEAGLHKYVFVSSESIYGFAYGGEHLRPQYLPIDEAHPLEPEDPYALSKLLGEEICKMYGRLGMKTVALRPSYVWTPEESEHLLAQVDNPDGWAANLWAYVHTEDVAQAVLLALETDLESGFEDILVNAADHGSRKDAEDLIEDYYSDIDTIAPDLRGAASFVSIAKAGKLLGYEPKHTWRDLK